MAEKNKVKHCLSFFPPGLCDMVSDSSAFFQYCTPVGSWPLPLFALVQRNALLRFWGSSNWDAGGAGTAYEPLDFLALIPLQKANQNHWSVVILLGGWEQSLASVDTDGASPLLSLNTCGCRWYQQLWEDIFNQAYLEHFKAEVSLQPLGCKLLDMWQGTTLILP